MSLALLNEKAVALSSAVWGWPFLIGFIVVGILISIVLGGVQFRYFTHAWALLISGQEGAETGEGTGITPFQAFVNALGNGIGNGSIAGVATAVAAGGPGAVLWMVVAGFLLMAIRYAEVYLGLTIKKQQADGNTLGGPMAYLTRLPFGASFLAYVYGVGCLIFGLLGGNAMQCNSMALGLQQLFGIELVWVGVGLTVFIVYVMVGGASRILKVSARLVPFKVGAFLVSALIVFVYYINQFIPALQLIVHAAFAPTAAASALLGITVRDAMRKGFSRAINASEAGTGTAAVLYGSVGSNQPVRDSILSMLSVFIGVDIICFLIALLIVMSGAWQTGLTSTPLMIAAYQGVFGSYASLVVAFCSVSFGIGVLVTYAFVGKQCWLYVTGNRLGWLFPFVYCLIAFVGSIASVDIVWSALELVNAFMLILNILGILYLLGTIRRALATY